jgi:hypothetical protein
MSLHYLLSFGSMARSLVSLHQVHGRGHFSRMFSRSRQYGVIGAVWSSSRTHSSSSSLCLLFVIPFLLHTLSLSWTDIGGWPRARYLISVLSWAVSLLQATNTFDCSLLFMYVSELGLVLHIPQVLCVSFCGGRDGEEQLVVRLMKRCNM